MSAPTPPVIPQPFAQSGDRNSIPNTTADVQRASFQLGYPPATMTPIDAGGVPMLGPDMNGILFDITAWLFALQGGQIQPYSADTAAAIGGYGQGALVAMADASGWWISTAANNSTDPDAGGADWQPVYTSTRGAFTVAGGTRTLTPVEAAPNFLVFVGTLLGNQQIVLPIGPRFWIIVNGCVMGGNTLTVRTSTQVGGIDVPAGGNASPTMVYCDGSNIQRVFVPSALPTSVSPAADTIPLRDNLGREFGLTAVPNTRTTQLATTEFVIPHAGTYAPNGVAYLPDGRIEQWGFTAFSDPVKTVFFPVEFPNACWNIQLTPLKTGASLPDKCPVVGSVLLDRFTMQDADGTNGTFWRALGN